MNLIFFLFQFWKSEFCGFVKQHNKLVWPNINMFQKTLEQLVHGAMVSGMHSIATIATEFELQVSIYRSRRYCRYRHETPIATIAEIEHERF